MNDPADITLRMKFALISDLVAEADHDGDESRADRLLTSPRFDEYDITHHLARQMGLDEYSGRGSDLHNTLLFVAQELNRSMSGHHPIDAALVADGAIKHLADTEVIATAMTGLKAWKSTTIQSCTIGTLARHLRKALTGAFEGSIARLDDSWRARDLGSFHDRREQAVERESERQAAWARELKEREVKQAELSAETKAAQAAARKRIAKRPQLSSGYQPPGRT